MTANSKDTDKPVPATKMEKKAVVLMFIVVALTVIQFRFVEKKVQY